MTRIFDPMVLDGKRILITGGGTGLGRGVAAQLVAHGAQVHLWGRRETVLAEAAAEISAGQPGRVHYQAVNVRDFDQVAAAIAEIWHRQGTRRKHRRIRRSPVRMRHQELLVALQPGIPGYIGCIRGIPSSQLMELVQMERQGFVQLSKLPVAKEGSRHRAQRQDSTNGPELSGSGRHFGNH